MVFGVLLALVFSLSLVRPAGFSGGGAVQPAGFVEWRGTEVIKDISVEGSDIGFEHGLKMDLVLNWRVWTLLGEPVVDCRAAWLLPSSTYSTPEAILKLTQNNKLGQDWVKDTIPWDIISRIGIVDLKIALCFMYTSPPTYLLLDPGSMSKPFLGDKAAFDRLPTKEQEKYMSFNVPGSPAWDKLFARNEKGALFVDKSAAQQIYLKGYHGTFLGASVTKISFDLSPVREYLLNKEKWKLAKAQEQKIQEQIAEEKKDADDLNKQHSKSPQKYVQYMEECKSGNNQSCNHLIQCYEYGNCGAPKDPEKALNMYTERCNSGDPLSCEKAGDGYFNGSGGVAKNIETAAEFYLKACQSGRTNNCHKIYSCGKCFFSGDCGAPKDPAKMEKLYRKACEQKVDYACRTLALCYLNGDCGLPAAPEKSGAFFLKSCALGYEMGCGDVGWCYQTGKCGLPVDPVQAGLYYRKACDLKGYYGCTMLGYCYDNGNCGLSVDKVNACMLWQKACDWKYNVACEAFNKSSCQEIIKPLALTSPVDRMVVADDKVTVSGTISSYVIGRNPKYLVSVNGRSQSVSVSWRQEGTFSMIVPLSPGNNQIEVSAELGYYKSSDTVNVKRVAESLSDVAVSQREITITIWDHGDEDGDQIDLIINSTTVLNNSILRNAPGRTVNVTLNPGKNVLVVHADNGGTNPPNTASIRISQVVQGNAEQKWELDAGESTALVITAP